MTNQEFSQIVSRYQNLVYTVCYQLVQDHQLAEDLTQDTFLTAFTHMDSCPAQQYKPWLARIAANKATDYLRSAWHRRVSSTEDDSLTLGASQTAVTPGPEELVLAEHEAQAIRAMVNDLKEPYLLVSQLYFLQQKTVDEIARALRRPPKTVQTQLLRAKKILQQRIRERSDLP